MSPILRPDSVAPQNSRERQPTDGSPHYFFVLDKSQGGRDLVDQYLRESDVSEMMTAAQDQGFRATLYDGVESFVAALSNGEWDRVHRGNKYVVDATMPDAGASMLNSTCDVHGIRLLTMEDMASRLQPPTTAPGR